MSLVSADNGLYAMVKRDVKTASSVVTVTGSQQLPYPMASSTMYIVGNSLASPQYIYMDGVTMYDYR